MKTIEEIRQENLTFLIQGMGGSIEKFSEKINKDRTQVSQWLSKAKTQRNIGSGIARDIETTFSKPRGWFDHDHTSTDQVSKIIENQRIVPIVTPEYLLTDHDRFESEDYVFTSTKFKGSFFALVNKDKGMLPDFAVGSLLIVDTGLTPEPGDFVIANVGERIVLRQFARPKPGVSGLKAFSDHHESYDSSTTPFKVLGVVVEHRRYLKDED